MEKIRIYFVSSLILALVLTNGMTGCRMVDTRVNNTRQLFLIADIEENWEEEAAAEAFDEVFEDDMDESFEHLADTENMFDLDSLELFEDSLDSLYIFEDSLLLYEGEEPDTFLLKVHELEDSLLFPDYRLKE